MEDTTKLVELLFERVTDYIKTGYELIKLKALDKTTDMLSTLITYSVVFVIIASFMLFANLGLAFWLGEILGKTYLGFFVVASFYGVLAIVLHFFMNKWFKRKICNYIIKLVYK